MPNIEISLEELVNDYDWRQVFCESGTPDTIPDNIEIDTSRIYIYDVIEIIAAVNGQNDGEDWVGVFKLKDGRYIKASGWCDYTGWDCQSGTSLEIAESLEDIVKFGLTQGEKERLGL
jgi:hypothetical protein